LSENIVTFLTRANCGLCSDAEPTVIRLVARAGAELRKVDVDSEPELRAEFGERVPVVVGPDGSVLAEGRVSGRELKKSLRRLR
jgi:thiol-disulfide isomerase/thioredoxin